MSGSASSYTSIALQSDMFGRNKYFQDVVFSNLQLDSAGNVGFDLEFTVDPAYVNYKSATGSAAIINPVPSNS
jgi:hypothetical protein